jgi:hypothetical protein
MSLPDEILKNILTRLGDVQFQTRPPKVTAAHCRHALELAKPGMIIGRTFDFYLDGKLIPGHYSHSGVIESSDLITATGRILPGSVVHAIAEGVGRCDILDFVKDCDGFIILDFDHYDNRAATITARSLVGHPYDFKFSINDCGSSLYCHETSCVCTATGGVVIVPSVKAGREFFTFDDILGHRWAKIIYEAKF